MSSNETDLDNGDGTRDHRSVERRIAAIERAVSTDEPLERTERLDELESRVVELEAAVQALRGYVGSVRAVNEEIENRADRALRTAEAVQRNVAPSSNADTEGDFGSDSKTDVEDRDQRSTPLIRLRERL